MNNYGWLLMRLDREHETARHLFEMAVELAPRFTEARLNLAVLLRQKFNDKEGAKTQNEEVINYNPSEERAYNNLANILTQQQPLSNEIISKVHDLYERALKLKPTYVAAHFNYGQFLSVVMSDFDKAEFHLKRVVEIEPNLSGPVTLALQRNEKLRKQSTTSHG